MSSQAAALSPQDRYERLLQLANPDFVTAPEAPLDLRRDGAVKLERIRNKGEVRVVKTVVGHGYPEFHREMALLLGLPGTWRIGGLRDTETTESRTSRKIVMQNCGLDLADWRFLWLYQDKGPLRDARFHLALWRGLLETLHPFHEAGYVHCDIKCDNVCLPLLNPLKPVGRGRNRHLTGSLDVNRPWLIDLGLSLQTSSGHQRTPAIDDDHRAICIQGAYVSPNYVKAIDDLCQGNTNAFNKLDWRIDLFSFGCMVTEFLDYARRNTSIQSPLNNNDTAYASAYAYLQALPGLLKSYDDPEQDSPPPPHKEIIKGIDRFLGKTTTTGSTTGFAVSLPAVWPADHPAAIEPPVPEVGVLTFLERAIAQDTNPAPTEPDPLIDPAPQPINPAPPLNPPTRHRLLKPVAAAASVLLMTLLAYPAVRQGLNATETKAKPATKPETSQEAKTVTTPPQASARPPLPERAERLAQGLMTARGNTREYTSLLAGAAPEAAER